MSLEDTFGNPTSITALCGYAIEAEAAGKAAIGQSTAVLKPQREPR